SEATLSLANGAASAIQSFVTIAALITIAAQGIFVVNFVKSLLKGREAVEENPWRATTLEWSLSSPPPLGNFAGPAPVVYRGAYEFGVLNGAEDFASQTLPTDSAPPAMPGGTDPGLRPVAFT